MSLKSLEENQIITELEELLVGAGGEAFAKIEAMQKVFCPFEAIGMIRQEIRHSNFLGFILDPTKPHGFDDLFLVSLVSELILQAEEGQFDVGLLDVHLMDFSQAKVYRERSNIDILIEVEGSKSGTQKRLVIAIELKIDASESKDQLSKYKKYVDSTYPSEEWDHGYIFLTKNGIDSSGKNQKHWVPISIGDLVNRFDDSIESSGISNKAVDLYRDYSAMIRKNVLEDPELEKLAKLLWAKHSGALEFLMERKPDLQGEVFDQLKSKSNIIIDRIKSLSSFELVPDTSSPRLLRFIVKEWVEIDGFCNENKSWVASGALIAIELADWGQGLVKVSYVLGPGEDMLRSNVYDVVVAAAEDKENPISIGRKTKTPGKKWKHLSSEYLQTREHYKKAIVSEKTAEELANQIIEKLIAFIFSNIGSYNKIIRDYLSDNCQL